MRRTWSLAGRVEELRFITAALHPNGGAGGVVLAGAAGVGKTRLAREAMAAVAQAGAVTHWAPATRSSRDVPLGAFAGLVGAAAGDPTQLLRSAADHLTAGAEAAGVVVVVDDAHLLDPLSALLVQHLVLRSAAIVIVTVRSGEQAPDAVTALWKDEHLDRLEVQPLSEPETAALLEGVVAGPVDSAAAHRIWTRTRGNPLFLRELVDGELVAGRLREVRGVWRWDDDGTVSARLVEVIAARIGTVSDAVGEVLDLLALCEPLDVEVLASLTEPVGIERAELRGLISVDNARQPLQAWLTHPLYGDARRASMGELRRRRLRGRIATAFGELGDQGADAVLRRAVLALDSDLTPDPRLLTVGAARYAGQLLDLALAARLARAAIAAGAGFEARLALAFALSFQGRGVEADDELSDLAVSASTDADRALVARVRACNLFWTLQRPGAAEAALAHAEATLTGDDPATRSLPAIRASFDAALARPRQAIQTARDALAAGVLDDQAAVMATYALVIGLGCTGRPDDMCDAFAAGQVALHRSFDAAYLRYGLVQLHLVGLHLAGHLVDGERVARDCYDESSHLPGGPRLEAACIMGRAALGRGRLRTAIRWLSEAAAGLVSVESHGHDYMALLALTEALAKTGDPTAADLLAELDANIHHGFVFLEPERLMVRAWVAAGDGAVTAAIALTHEAAAIAAACGQFAHEVLALQTAACFGDPSVAGRLAELARMVGGPRAPAAAAHAAALASGDGDALLDASRQLEQFGDLVAAADAAAQAADAYTAHGRRGSAHTAANRAQVLADACEGARTPAILATARPLPLTQREREIAILAALDLTNRQIAERLTVSVRTVEGHLYRAQAKLGISNRSQLAAVLDGE